MKKEQKQEKYVQTTFINPLTGEVSELPVVLNQPYAKVRKNKGEVNKGKSKTIPGQSMSVQAMLKRHRSGLPINAIALEPIYTGDDLKEDLNDMDEVDKQAYMDSVADRLVEARARIENTEKTQKEKDFIKKVDAQVNRRLKSMRDELDAKQKGKE